MKLTDMWHNITKGFHIPTIPYVDIENTLLDPNFLIDIWIKFVLVSSLIYILYKFFLVDMTLEHIINQVSSHLNIYIGKLKEQNINTEYLNKQMDNIILDYQSAKSTKNSDTNDINFAIIYSSMVISITITVVGIIFFTGGYKLINYSNILYNILFSIIALVVSQLLFFYLVYSYIDPIKIYKIFYYDYLINNNETVTTNTSTVSNTTKTTTALATTTTTTEQLPSQRLKFYYDYLINNNETVTTNTSNNSNTTSTLETTTTEQLPSQRLNNTSATTESIITTSGTATIFIFMIIFVSFFIISAVIITLNILVLYTNYNIPKIIIPTNNFTLPIYSLIGFIFLFLFIILLLLLLKRI